MVIRKAILQDAETISRIVCLCYEDFVRTDGFSYEVVAILKKTRGSVEHIKKLTSKENLFVADGVECIKGMVSVCENEITKLYVTPSWQRMGVGKQLFEYAESFIGEGGYQEMVAGVVAQSPVGFYETMGMHNIEQRVVAHGPCAGMLSVLLTKSIACEQGTNHETD